MLDMAQSLEKRLPAIDRDLRVNLLGKDEIDEPQRVVWAERDRIIPFEHNGLALLERVPGAELVWLAGVGHVPMSDDPEQVARLILEVTGAVDRAHEKDRGGAPIAPHARPSEAS